MDLERRVLNAPEHDLMDPGLVEAFCKEYTAERNRLQDAALAGRGNLGKKLARVRGDQKILINDQGERAIPGPGRHALTRERGLAPA